MSRVILSSYRYLSRVVYVLKNHRPAAGKGHLKLAATTLDAAERYRFHSSPAERTCCRYLNETILITGMRFRQVWRFLAPKEHPTIEVESQVHIVVEASIKHVVWIA